jgi:UDP-glucose 4-epimerase
MKKIVVTGGLGFIGHHLVGKLIQENIEKYDITIVDDLSNTNPRAPMRLFGEEWQQYLESGGVAQYSFLSPYGHKVTFVKEDIRNREKIQDIFKRGMFDSCIHLAAKISVVESVANPQGTVETNVQGTANVLDGCASINVENVVFASTGAVYGEPKILPIREDHVLEPIAPYGASKVAGEMLLSSYAHCGKIRNGVALRFFNVYGQGQVSQYAGVITSFMERLSKGLPPIIYGDGKQTRDFVSVHDIAGAIRISAKTQDIPGSYQAFNVATGSSISIEDLAHTMIRIYGFEGMMPIFNPERKGDIKAALVDVSKAEKMLGFKASITPDSGLSQLIAQSKQTTEMRQK